SAGRCPPWPPACPGRTAPAARDSTSPCRHRAARPHRRRGCRCRRAARSPTPSRRVTPRSSAAPRRSRRDARAAPVPRALRPIDPTSPSNPPRRNKDGAPTEARRARPRPARPRPPSPLLNGILGAAGGGLKRASGAAACSSPKCSASHAPGASRRRSRAARPPPGRDTLDAPSALIYRSSLYRASISGAPPARRGARDHERERRSGSDVMQRTMLEAQALAKTIHELLVLATLRDGDKHGYQIALDVEERSEGAFVFQHGTLYPILHRLEAEKLIRGRWSGGEGQRRRKVYAL